MEPDTPTQRDRPPDTPTTAEPPTSLDGVRGFAAGLSRITERWVPDSWVICMTLTVLAVLLAVWGAGASLQSAILAWGGGMWSLLELAMQFTIAMVAAHVCVSSPPAHKLMDRIAALPNPDRPVQAILVAGLFSLFAAYLNWAFCVVASALFVPFLCRRNPHVDIRVLIAASYVGMGTVWHGGLSASGPLILATPGNPLLEPVSGRPVVDRLIPVTENLFSPFNLIYLVVVSAAALLAVVALHPRRNAVTLSRARVDALLPAVEKTELPRTPGERIDRFPGWTLLAALLILYPLGYSMVTQGFGRTWTINAYNMVFLSAALLLHGRASSFVNAFRRGVGTASGIILQFPFYAGIFGILNSTELGVWLGSLFVRVATTDTFPLIVYLYSGIMNVFVPSGGSKWLIEAPFLVPAARELGVSPNTLVLAYAYGDSTTNLIQPFWALPLMAVTRIRFGDIVGYTSLIMLVCSAVTVIALLLIPPML